MTPISDEIKAKIHEKAVHVANDWISVEKNPEEWHRKYNSFYDAAEYGLSLASQGWVSVKERLPTKDDVFDDYDEVLTIQVGRQRPTMMKYWEIKSCPFTKYWLRLPPIPKPIYSITGKINVMSKKIKVFELDFGDTNLLSEDPKPILAWIETDMAGLKEGDDLQYTITIRMMARKQIDALPEWS